jgi:hypothetical protein
MHKKAPFFASILVALAMPYLLFAQNFPSVTSFKVAGPFVAGSVFTITRGTVPDLTKAGPTVTLDGKALTVTGATKNTITGTLPAGVSKKGGDVRIRYGTVVVEDKLYVPFLDNIFVPKVEKGAQMNFNGGNFKEKDCKINFGGNTFAITRCSQNQILATIGTKFNGGEVTITSNGLTSAPLRFEFQGPVLTFAENKGGIAPGSTLTLHAKGLSPVINENLITLDKTVLTITDFKPKEELLVVKLPDENAKGGLKLTVNGFESNTIAIDANPAPILMDSRAGDEGTVFKVKVTGKYFASDMAKVSLSIGPKKGTVKFANINNIEAEFPRGSYAGCLSVEVFGQTSNCIAFNSTKPPYLKGYQDPIFIESVNQYEWSIFAENMSEKNDKIAVYVNGAKASLRDRLLNRVTVRFDAIPDVGEVYVTSEGLESNRMPYDFGQRFYPFVSSAISNGKFMYAQPVALKGTNLGQHQFREKTKINLSGMGLTKDEKTKELEWKVTPAQIDVRLDDKVKKDMKATLSVTVKGKKSNELKFTAGQDAKEAVCSPWVQKVQYPEGIMEGSTIRLLGQCFNPDPAKNWIYFDGMETRPTLAKLTFLEVKIPKGAKTAGKLKVKTQINESNEADYVSAGLTPNAFTFEFEDLGKNALSTVNKEAPFAKLVIRNTLGEVEMQTLKFKFVFEDDKKDPFSITKVGVLPLGEVKVAFSGVGKKTIAPMLIQRDGTNAYSFTLDGIRISPSTKPQTLEFRTTAKPFILPSATFHMEFDPAKIENFSGLLIRRDKQEIIKLGQAAISSLPVSATKTVISCYDSDSKKANCSKLTGGETLQEPAPSTKPKLPSIPKK